MQKLKNSTKTKAVLAAVFVAFTFVFMGVWARELKESFTLFQQVYLRIFLAGIIALVVFRKKFNGLFSDITARDWKVYILRSVSYYGVGVTVGTIAVHNTSLSTTAFIASLPIIGLLAWIVFREKVPLKSLPFILLSILGLAFVVGLNFSNLSLGVGEIAAVISMLGFNIGYLLSRMHGKNKNNFENTTILLLIAWIPIFILAIFDGGILPQAVTAKSIAVLLISSVLNIVLIYLINYVFNVLKAYVVGNLLLLESVFAIIIGFILYGEEPSIGALTGGGIIIGCAFVINRIESRGAKKLADK